MQAVRGHPVGRVRAIAQPYQSSKLALPRRGVCATSKAVSTSPGGALTESEQEVLKKYTKEASPSGIDAVLKTLSQAATQKMAPETVEGALLTLEKDVQSKPAGIKPDVSGTWRLVFSTATKIRWLQYIPVKEDFVIDVAGKKLSLESSLGPFDFYIRGQILGWQADMGKLEFQFGQVDIHLLQKQVWQVTPKTQPKHYTFFFVADKIAVARSSQGGLALMRK